MTIPKHTFGADCRLAPLEPATRDDGIPALEAQYFYSSAITIDDPNWTTAPSDVNGTGSGKSQLRAFGRGDNNALERAWRSLMSKDDRALHSDLKKKPKIDDGDIRCDPSKRDDIVRVLGQRHSQLHLNGGLKAAAVVSDMGQSPTSRTDTADNVSCCQQLAADISTEINQAFCSEIRHADPTLQIEVLAHDVTTLVTRKSSKDSSDSKLTAIPIHPKGSGERDGMQSLSSTPRSGLKMTTKHLIDAGHEREAGGRSRSLSQATNRSSHTPTSSGLTGQPFARAAARDDSQPPSKPSQPAAEAAAKPDMPQDNGETNEEQIKTLEPEQKSVLQVTVGVSKLHIVALPTLQMKPIYWSPVNDIAVVTRATWFYRYFIDKIID